MEELKIISPDAPELVDFFENFDINSIPKEKRDAIYKSYTNDYIMSLDHLDDDDDIEELLENNFNAHLNEDDESEYQLVMPVTETIKRLKSEIPSLSDEQFITITNNGIESLRINSQIPIYWKQPIMTVIPDEYINIRIIDEKMNECGYVNVRKSMRKDYEGRQWWFVIYNPNPKFMKDVRDIMADFRLFHYTPEENRDSILDTGLIPSHGGRTYFYEDERVFFVTNYKKHPFEFSKKYKDMMRNISAKLKKNDKNFVGYFDLFELDVDKLPERIKIYWDPNSQDGVYLNAHIEPEWLIFHKDKNRSFDR